MTHFVAAAYFTKEHVDPNAAQNVRDAVHAGDELAVHLHAWRSLAKASEIAPKLSPSFLTGTDKLLEFEDGDLGFDTDLDAYSVVELRALLRTSRRLLEQTKLPVAKTFRAGGYLGTPKVLQAIHDEGYTVDSSAYRRVEVGADTFLPKRLAALWPKIDAKTQPYLVHMPGGDLLEMPIAAVSDYVVAADIVDLFDAAHAQLQKTPDRDVFVVLAFHEETAAEFAGRIAEAMQRVRARPELARELIYVTVDKAAELAREGLAPSGT